MPDPNDTNDRDDAPESDTGGIDVNIGEREETVGDMMDPDARARAEQTNAQNPPPKARAAIAALDPADVTPQMLDHDVRFEHMTDDLRREAKQLHGFPTGETPPPDPNGDHSIALSWDEVDAEPSPGAGEPLRQGDADRLLAPDMSGPPAKEGQDSGSDSDRERGQTASEAFEQATGVSASAVASGSSDDAGESTNIEASDGEQNKNLREDSGASANTETNGGNKDGEDDRPEPRTLTETGLVDADGQFPWESEEEGVVETDAGEREQVRFEYVGTPFEITEPDDPHALENAADSLMGIQDARKPERDRKVDDYFGTLADMCLTVDGTPHDQMVVVARPDGKRDLLTHETAAKYGLVASGGGGPPASADGGTSVADELGVTVAPLWEALTPFQRRKLGQKMDRFASGEDSFRPRFR